MPHRWKKKLGQHLLHDHNILRKIVSALQLSAGEHVIEIGSGSGELTEFLVNEPAHVTSIEIDPQFNDTLSQRFESMENITLITGNILTIRLKDHVPENYKAVIAGNLPYNIASRILFHLFNQRDRIRRMVFTLQKEVARRITSPPRNKDRGILSVLCQFHSSPEILFPVSRNCFYPKPRVDSAVVALDLQPVPRDVNPEKLMHIVKTCFGRRRKTLRNTLALLPDVPHDKWNELASDFNLDRRPEELEVNEFVRLTRVLSNVYTGNRSSSIVGYAAR